MIGGKFIGSGTYGCIFNPAFSCSSSDKQIGSVSKIFDDDNEFKNELQLGRTLKQIDSSEKFTNPVVDNCTVSIKDVKKSNTKNECKLIRSSKPTYHQIVYKHKGIDLKYFMKNFEYNIFENKINNFVTNMLLGVKALQDHQLAHLDIKPENMLVTDDNRLLLIDFGLARNFKDVYNTQKSRFLLEYSYFIYPPEFKVSLMLKKLKHSKILDSESPKYIKTWKEEIYRLNNKWFKGYEILVPYFQEIGIFTPEMECQYIHFMDKLIKIKPNHTSCFSSQFDKFAKKADVFSVGICLLLLYIHSNDKDKLDKKNRNSFIELIRKCISMNPFERLSIEDVIHDYHLITNNTPSPIKLHSTLPDTPPPPPSTPPFALDKTYCMKYFSLNDLKQKVDNEINKGNKNLTKSLKSLKKEKLCEAVLPYLPSKLNPKTVKKGPKKKK